MRGQAAAAVAIAAGAVLVMCATAFGAAVTYQGDAAHTGNVDAPFKPPLVKRWARRGLGTRFSYPVIGDGKVFITAAAPTGRLLYALKRTNGATVWVRPVPPNGLPAYANGRVFVAGDGDLKAYSAASGQQLWLIEDPARVTPPVTDGSLVYVGDEEGVKSYEQITGAPVAHGSTDEAGFIAVPGVAVTDAQVYAAVGCDVYMFTKGLSERVWRHQSRCGRSAYGAFPPALAAGRVFARSETGRGTELDAALGLPKDTFTSFGGLALSGNLAFYRGTSTVQARRIDTGTIVWTRTSRANGFAGSLLAVRRLVYALRGDGTVIAFDRRTGNTRWSRRLSRSAYPSYSPYGPPIDGMAADSGGLVVPSGNRVTALGPRKRR